MPQSKRNSSSQRKKNYRPRRARTSLTNNKGDYELEGDINLPIKKESDSMNEDKSDDNNVGVQISIEMQTVFESTRPTRNRQLLIRYR